MTEGAVCPDEAESAQTGPPRAVRPPIWHRSSWKVVHSFQKQRFPISLGPILEVIWGMSVQHSQAIRAGYVGRKVTHDSV